METVIKEWGREEILVNEPEYCAKYLYILPGKKCSLHWHATKKETFLVQWGTVYLEHGTENSILGPGDSKTIVPGMQHRFASDLGARILEVSTFHSDSDVVRLEPSGNL